MAANLLRVYGLTRSMSHDEVHVLETLIKKLLLTRSDYDSVLPLIGVPPDLTEPAG